LEIHKTQDLVLVLAAVLLPVVKMNFLIAKPIQD